MDGTVGIRVSSGNGEKTRDGSGRRACGECGCVESCIGSTLDLGCWSGGDRWGSADVMEVGSSLVFVPRSTRVPIDLRSCLCWPSKYFSRFFFNFLVEVISDGEFDNFPI